MTATPAQDLATQVADLRAEGDALFAVVSEFTTADWQRVSSFKGWTLFDVVAHLHFSDELGLRSLEGAEHFQAALAALGKRQGSTSAYTRTWLGTKTPAELLRRWRAAFVKLCDSLTTADPARRMAWAGPGMKPRMFATARQMEIWAHGWEIYDALGLVRTHRDRLFNIATIGVRTYGWTFTNRGLAVPEPAPYVLLTAPSGAEWTWHEPGGDSVIGSAVEFCQVATQVRNVADTALVVDGENAGRWMAIAQCFAGPPEDPPPPGTRTTR